MLLNCGVGEDSWESLGLQGDPTSPSWRRSVLGCSLEGLLLMLELQYFGHFMRRVDSLEKTLMLGGIGGRRRRGRQGINGWMASPTQWVQVWVNSGSLWDREAWRAAIHGITKSRTQLRDWTELNWTTTLQMMELKWRHGGGVVFIWQRPYKRGKFGHRQTHTKGRRGKETSECHL